MPERLPLSQLREGMVLACPIADRSGRLLAGAGERLDSRVLVRMRTAGVAFAEVADGERLPPAAGADANLEAQVDLILARKFQGTEGKPYMSEIRELAKRHLISRRRVPS